jgi:hypothetical protein
MSKIGTAVKKNTKFDKGKIRQLNTNSFQKMSRKTNIGNSTHLRENPSLKARVLKHGMDKPEIKEQIIHRDQ